MSFTFHEEEYRGCKIRIESDDDPLNPRKEYDNVGTMVCFHDRYDLGDKQEKRGTGDEYIESLAYEHGDHRFRRWFELYESAGRGHCWGGPVYARIERHYRQHMERVLSEQFVMLTLYLYDHSGITMSTGPFSCPWDSGRVGFIYCTLDDARKNWMLPDTAGWDHIVYPEDKCPDHAKGSNYVGKTLRQCAEMLLEGEVETYDDYLTGQVAGWIAEDPDGETIESVWGYFPDHGVPHSQEWDRPIGEARSAIDHWIQSRANDRRKATLARKKEATEAAHWAARDVQTISQPT